MSNLPLLVYAKEPIAGQVKTRLQSHCSPVQAAQIAQELLRSTLNAACQHWPGEVILMAWPSHRDAFVSQLAAEFGIKSASQSAGDLGEKMARGAREFGFPVAIIGSDTPHVTAEVLAKGHRLLNRKQRVLGPSTDGGYYFLGLSQDEPYLFENIEWGSSAVLESTLNRADFQLLPPMTDVDHWQDLLEVSRQLPTLRTYLNEQGLVDYV